MAWLCHTNEKPNGREISRNTATSKMTGAEGMDSADACDHLLCNATCAALHGYGGHKSGRKGRPSTRQGPWGDVADWQCGKTSPCRGTPNTRHADKPPPHLVQYRGIQHHHCTVEGHLQRLWGGHLVVAHKHLRDRSGHGKEKQREE